MQGVATSCATPGSAPLDRSRMCRSDLATRRRGDPLAHEAVNHESKSRCAEHRPILLLPHHKRLPNRDHYLTLQYRAHRLRGRGADCSPRPCTPLRKDRL